MTSASVRARLLVSAGLASAVAPALAAAAEAPAVSVTAQAHEGFTGHIGTTRADSTPAFPARPQPPAGAPNVLLVLIDDAGFAAASVYGGGARTPNLERYAAEGVRYDRFHVVGICSPTRASLLTGRNHHEVGFGNLANVAAGYPAYNSIWKPETASIARILQLNGYSTAAFGKWHNTPQWEISPAGPFNHWPTGLGFDHYYGFMAGDDNQWEPHLYNDTTQVPAPGTPEEGYHLTPDLVNHAISWVDDHAAVGGNRPYFLYFATGAVHMPHHVPQAWIDRNKGRFDEGWDAYREAAFARQKRLGVIPADAKLTPRPAALPAWDSLTPDQKRLYAHQMEVFSAYMEETDAEVGRLIDTLRHKPGGDNLLVLYIAGDNGGSAEGDLGGAIENEGAISAGAPNDFATQLADIDKLGGPDIANHYSAGWAWATSTPFQWMKQIASHFGATRDPLIVDWPGHTSQPGKVRTQFGHVNDIAPTILAAAGLTLPASIDGVAQVPFEGKSLLPTFTNPDAPDVHTEQYFEIFGNRAIYKDGWVAAAKRSWYPWDTLHAVPALYADNTDQDRWELYHVATDYSEAEDLAAKYPEKLAELKAEFASEGRRNGVFPLLPLPQGAPTIFDPRRQTLVVASDTTGLPPNAIPPLAGKLHRWEVAVTGNAAAGTGVLLAQGGRLGGYVLYVKDGHLSFENNTFGKARQTIVATAAVPEGASSLGFEFVPTAGRAPRAGLLGTAPTDGKVRLLIDGRPVGEGAVHLYPAVAGAFAESFDVGRDRNSQVSREPAARQPYSQPLGDARLTIEAPAAK